MPMLNPSASPFVPSAFAAATAAAVAAGGDTAKQSASPSVSIPISIRAAAAAVRPFTANLLLPQHSAGEGGPTTPNSVVDLNGLAELASVMSGAISAELTFDDIFNSNSRRNSLADALPEILAAAAPAAPEPGPVPLVTWPPPPRPGAPSTTSCISVASTVGSSGSDAGAVEQARHELRSDGPVQSCSATGMPASTKVGPRDFDILRVVGQGAFGKVFQVRHRSSGRLYAMKVMRKERILERDHGDYVRAERDVLTAVVHPYIVTLRFSFQTPSKLYLVLDFMNGGHLFFNLYRQGVFDEDVARLYMAEIVSAISYLHSRNIVHRDLKPENVLLDTEGHVRLTDFGLAKGNMDEGSRTNSFIGTMEYMAPEIIEGKGHGKEVDWWSTGILLYEMLAGVPPFRAKSRQVLQQQITSGKIKWPKFLSPASLSLLKGLLTRDPAKRLGNGPNGSAAIRAHAFFKGINWQALEERRIPSKFKPKVSHSLSVENFDAIWTEQAPEDSPCGSPTDPTLATAFQGFTYTSPSFLTASVMALALEGTAKAAPGATGAVAAAGQAAGAGRVAGAAV